MGELLVSADWFGENVPPKACVDMRVACILWRACDMHVVSCMWRAML